MENTRLKIDLGAGILEVEGEEGFVSRIYDEFKEKLTTHPLQRGRASERTAKQKSTTGAKPKKVGRKESFSIAKDLDLSGKGKRKTLREFYKEKSPTVALEMNAVFVYYLSRIAGVKKIGLDHIYTCYKDVGARVPTALRQSVLDTSFKKGWLDTSSMEDIKPTTAGENFVEHDLPKKPRQ